MGANAATKLYRVLENCQTIQGIELLNAAQAFEFRRPLKTSDSLEKLFAAYREKVKFIEDDVYLHPIISESIKFTRQSFKTWIQ
jgi:histidine ammonia-lyase